MANAASSSASSVGNAISLGKDLFALLRDVSLGTLVILLLLFPSFFNDRLTQAGFEEGSFAGLKWKAKLVESDVALKEARTQITDLTDQLTRTLDKLRQAEIKVDDPGFKAEVAKLDSDSKSVSVAASKVSQNRSRLLGRLFRRAQLSWSNLIFITCSCCRE